jgi:hypothetical protein
MEATAPTPRYKSPQSVGRGTVNCTACDEVYAAILRQMPKVHLKETTPSFRQLRQIRRQEPERPFKSNSD